MLTSFPHFKLLQLDDRPLIEAITNDHTPCSDFNFTSMWIWNIKELIQTCTHLGSLVVRFTDYITGEPFYSFCGGGESRRCTSDVLELCHSTTGQAAVLKLIPEYCVRSLANDHQLLVQEDRDNFDYIYDVGQLCTYSGGHFKTKRELTNHFERLYAPSVRMLDLTDDRDGRAVTELFDRWVEQKEADPLSIANERDALHRFLMMPHSLLAIRALGLFVQSDMVGFGIHEILRPDYALGHFEKALLTSFKGIYPYLRRETARMLASHDVSQWNFEQDLGLPGLRKCKTSYRPCDYVKKYTVRWR